MDGWLNSSTSTLTSTQMQLLLVLIDDFFSEFLKINVDDDDDVLDEVAIRSTKPLASPVKPQQKPLAR